MGVIGIGRGKSVGNGARNKIVYLSDFGVKTNNADNKTGIVKGFDYAYDNDVKQIVFPSGIINTTKGIEINIKDDVTIDFNSAVINDVSDYNSDTFLTVLGSNVTENSTTLSSDAIVGAKTISLTSATGVVAGSLIILRPETVAATAGNPGEVHRCLSVDGTTVTLENILRVPYAVSAAVLIVQPIRNLTLKNGTIKTNGKSVRALKIRNLSNSKIEALSILDDLPTRIDEYQYDFSEGLRIENAFDCQFNKFYSTKHRYGMYIAHASFMEINNSNGDNGWHTFESVGCNWDITYNNCHTIRDEFGFRSHWGGNLTYNNCYTKGGMGWYIDCVDATFNNCKIIDSEMQITNIRPSAFGGAFNTGTTRKLVINGMQITGVDAGKLWEHGTNTIRTDRYVGTMEINDLYVEIKDDQYIVLADFHELKTKNLYVKSLEYFGAPVAQAIGITSTTSHENVKVFHKNLTIEGVYHRALYHSIRKESSLIEIDGLKLIGAYLTGGASSSRVVEFGGLDEATVRIKNVDIDISGTPTMEKAFNITSKNAFISNVSYYRGLTTTIVNYANGIATVPRELTHFKLFSTGLSYYTVAAGIPAPVFLDYNYNIDD